MGARSHCDGWIEIVPICHGSVSIKGRFSPLDSPLRSQPNRPVLTVHHPLSNCLRKELQARSVTVMAFYVSRPLILHQTQQLSAFNAICNHASVFMPSPTSHSHTCCLCVSLHCGCSRILVYSKLFYNLTLMVV